MDVSIEKQGCVQRVAPLTGDTMTTSRRGILIDVTERKQAEDRLASQARVLRHTLENVAEGVIIADQEGIIRSANPASHKIFGYDKPGLEGKSINILMPPQVSDVYDSWVEEYIAGLESQVIGQDRDLMAVRKTGEEFPIELQISVFSATAKE